MQPTRWTVLLDDLLGGLYHQRVPAIEPFYPELGRRIQAARTRLGWPQAELARRMSPPLTRASIANIESGKQRVLCHTVVELAALLQVELKHLLPTAATPTLNLDDIRTELARKVGRTVAEDVVRSVTTTVVRTRPR